MVILLPTGIIMPVAAQEATSSDTKCVLCVIFELHDVADYGYGNTQVAVMDLFMQEGKPLWELLPVHLGMVAATQLC